MHHHSLVFLTGIMHKNRGSAIRLLKVLARFNSSEWNITKDGLTLQILCSTLGEKKKAENPQTPRRNILICHRLGYIMSVKWKNLSRFGAHKSSIIWVTSISTQLEQINRFNLAFLPATLMLAVLSFTSNQFKIRSYFWSSIFHFLVFFSTPPPSFHMKGLA